MNSFIWDVKCMHLYVEIIVKMKKKGIFESYSKNINFDEYKKCLDGKDYQKECDNSKLRSLNHEMYLQKVLKSTLSPFDDERCYINIIESKPWN